MASDKATVQVAAHYEVANSDTRGAKEYRKYFLGAQGKRLQQFIAVAGGLGFMLFGQ